MAATFRPLRRARCSCDASTDPPSACSGVTESTRREPAHAAAHVVSATTPAGISSAACTTAYSTPSIPSSAVRTSTPAAAIAVPPRSPRSAPIAPTMSPCCATSPRWARAEAPMSLQQRDLPGPARDDGREGVRRHDRGDVHRDTDEEHRS